MDFMEFGGDARIRTEDLFHAMETLYQLSYIPTIFGIFDKINQRFII